MHVGVGLALAVVCAYNTRNDVCEHPGGHAMSVAAQRGTATARPRTIAHRGASALAPENTFASFATAIELGVEWVETDVRMTRDGHLVCIHDATLDRTTNGTGPVNEMDLADIRQLDAGSWFDRSGAKLPWDLIRFRVLTLTEVLDLTRGRATLVLHLKSPELYPGLEQRILDDLQRSGVLDGDGDVLLESFSVGSMRLLALLAPRIPRIQLVMPGSDALSDSALDKIAGYAQGIGPCQTTVTAERVAAAHVRGLQVTPWTVNARKDMERLIQAGVDGIITDNPVELSVVRERAARA